MSQAPELLVLESFRTPKVTTNPYLIMLSEALAESRGVKVVFFNWQTAIFGKYDVLHMHWPEVSMTGANALSKLGRQLLYSMLMIRVVLTNTPIVRTVHNVDPPQGISRREILLLHVTDRLTTVRIRLNDFTPTDSRRPTRTVLLGHYRDWFADHSQALSGVTETRGRIAFFGLIRHYKGVERLIEAFCLVDRDLGVTLSIAGKPTSSELGNRIAAAAEADSRIHASLEFLSDEDLVHHVLSSQLVVMPYREMHNSSGAITALSLSRPVLMPANDVNRALALEVGGGWIYLYDGELTPDHLCATLDSIVESPPQAPPDLTGRDWTDTRSAHVAAFQLALEKAPGWIGSTRRRRKSLARQSFR